MALRKLEKIDTMLRINPLYEADGYKVGHKLMLAPNTVGLYGTWIPRSLKYMHPSIKKIMSAGQQMVVRYIHGSFQENFFNQPIDVAEKFGKDMCEYLMLPYDHEHFMDLHKLGYLPYKVKALKEGTMTAPNVPHATFRSTKDHYAWLTLYLETFFSKLAWQFPTAATITYQFKKNAVEWVRKTDIKNLWLADFMCHDFHSRGGNPFTSNAVGLGHAFSSLGSDTLNVIPAARYYYDFDENKVPVYSVNASEHSVTCTGIFYYEGMLRAGEGDEYIKEYYSFDAKCEGSVENPDYLAIAEWLNLRDWLKKFPKGILSVVSDTFDLWKLITFILPRLKKEIMARDGKLVIRPDSGNPVDIICGVKMSKEEYEETEHSMQASEFDTLLSSPKHKGVIELLWDIFGGTVNEQGYKCLDPHIGAIYGDSITLERQVNIYSRLADKGFAATNIVLGVGSYQYVMLTRDSAGYAAKGAQFETAVFKLDGVSRTQYNIYKDPITDDGTKKSLKGYVAVFDDGKGGHIVKPECTAEEEETGLLQTIYEDGMFDNQITLDEIRADLSKLIEKELANLELV